MNLSKSAVESKEVKSASMADANAEESLVTIENEERLSLFEIVHHQYSPCFKSHHSKSERLATDPVNEFILRLPPFLQHKRWIQQGLSLEDICQIIKFTHSCELLHMMLREDFPQTKQSIRGSLYKPSESEQMAKGVCQDALIKLDQFYKKMYASRSTLPSCLHINIHGRSFSSIDFDATLFPYPIHVADTLESFVEIQSHLPSSYSGLSSSSSSSSLSSSPFSSSSSSSSSSMSLSSYFSIIFDPTNIEHGWMAQPWKRYSRYWKLYGARFVPLRSCLQGKAILLQRVIPYSVYCKIYGAPKRLSDLPDAVRIRNEQWFLLEEMFYLLSPQFSSILSTIDIDDLHTWFGGNTWKGKKRIRGIGLKNSNKQKKKKISLQKSNDDEDDEEQEDVEEFEEDEMTGS